MVDVLAEGRQLLTAWNGGRNVSDEIAGFFSAHGEALLAVAAQARSVSDAHNAVDDVEHYDHNCESCRATLRKRVAKLDVALAALNPGDARDHAVAGASPGEGETQES